MKSEDADLVRVWPWPAAPRCRKVERTPPRPNDKPLDALRGELSDILVERAVATQVDDFASDSVQTVCTTEPLLVDNQYY